MQHILVVIDMQNDFITGSLGSPEAVAVVDAVRRRIESFEGEIIFTRDTHTAEYPHTQEGRMLPVAHCLKDSSGWHIADGLVEAAEMNSHVTSIHIINKPNFGSLDLLHRLQGYAETDPELEVTLIGLCTDICVVSNALLIKTGLPEVPVYIDARCCAGVTPESHRAALETMKRCQCHILE